MQINNPVLMPVWMIIVAIIGLVLVAAWLLRSLLVTRRDRSREVGDIPMAPSERNRWSDRVEAAQKRFAAGEIDLRGLHLELASVLRGFAAAAAARTLRPPRCARSWTCPIRQARSTSRTDSSSCVVTGVRSTPTRWGMWASSWPYGSSPLSTVIPRPRPRRP